MKATRVRVNGTDYFITIITDGYGEVPMIPPSLLAAGYTAQTHLGLLPKMQAQTPVSPLLGAEITIIPLLGEPIVGIVEELEEVTLV